MRKASALSLILVSLIGFCAASSSSVKAQSRTIVIPDDYPTVARALSNAADGDTIFIRKGVYQEHSLVVDKSVSLVGENPIYTTINDTDPNIISYGALGIPITSVAVTVAAAGVKIINLTVTGGESGVVGQGYQTQIMNNIIIVPDGCVSLDGTKQSRKTP